MNVTTRNWPGWYVKRNGENFRVLLNGAERNDCIAADEEHGFVVVIRKRADGKIRLNRERNAVSTKKLRGVVKIDRVSP